MRLSQLVLSIDENDPETLASVGWAKAYIAGDFGAAMEMVDRAVSLNPNSSIAWGYRGDHLRLCRTHGRRNTKS